MGELKKGCLAQEHAGGVGKDCPCGNQWLDDEQKPDCQAAIDLSKYSSENRTTAADILEDMASTYRERNAVYGDNFRMVGPIMETMFPKGVPASLLGSDQFHLFELIIVKLTRFAVSNLEHIDSIHDAGVYSAMIESILNNKEGKNG